MSTETLKAIAVVAELPPREGHPLSPIALSIRSAPPAAWRSPKRTKKERKPVITILANATNERIIGLVEGLAAAPQAEASACQVSDFYRSWMDEAAIEAKGWVPIKPLLSKINGIRDQAGLARALECSWLSCVPWVVPWRGAAGALAGLPLLIRLPHCFGNPAPAS